MHKKQQLFLLLVSLIFSHSFADDSKKSEKAANVGVSQTMQTLSPEQIKANNQTAKKFVAPSDEATATNQNLKEAAKATIQIVSKCSVGITENGYYIGSGPSEFCAGHPLSAGGPPRGEQPGKEDSKTMADIQGTGSNRCESKACSGALIGGQDVIGTAAHCLGGRTPQDFCKDFVVVFNRSGNKTSYSKDEVFECEGGVSVDTAKPTEDVNLNSDKSIKDHAFLKLKKPVPTSTASALKLRTTEVNQQEDLYAVGHPYGTPRMISTVKSPTRTFAEGSNGTPDKNNYNYVLGEAYVYQGNSGGPLIDKNGQLVGIMGSVDDTRHGDAREREPRVKVQGQDRPCRTQVPKSSLKVEAIGFGNELRKTLNSQMSNNPEQTDTTNAETIK